VRILSTSVLVLLFSSIAIAGDPTVELKKNNDTVDIQIGGEQFAVFNFSANLPKPFMYPVRGPGGTILTREIEKEGDDHPHHKGVWVAVDEVNEIRFWAEKGKIKNVTVKPLTAKGNPAKLLVVNEWLGDDGKPVVTEKTIIGIYANRLMTYDITFIAGAKSATFRDTKEGLFGFRMVDSMRENEGGHVVNAEGLKDTKNTWGKRSAWIDYYGKVDGKTFGVTLFDHPKNFRPSRYHVRNYGLFSINPFGEKAYTRGASEAAPEEVKPKSTLNLRYGLYIHAGDTKSAGVADVYQQFVKSGK
jgi:hypothetical protein